MKKIVLAVFFLIAIYAGAFAFGKWSRMQSYSSPKEKDEFLGSHFQPTRYPLENRPFVLFVVGCNNGASVEKTLKSIFSQRYENYRLIYIDDGSTDGSFEHARDLIYESGQIGRTTLIRNTETLGELATLARAAQNCPDSEIFVWIGGDDWLAHEWVLSRLNEYYADPDLWMTYGQYREFPHFRIGHCRPIKQADWKEKGFRLHPFVTSHLKTFYAGLLKKVQEADFAYQGIFLPAAAELAVMIPLLELAQEHFQYIPETLSIVNRQIPPREDRELTLRCERYIRALSSYTPLTSLSEPAHE